MREVVFSEDVKNGLALLKEKLEIIQGEKKAKKTLKAIVDSLDNLSIHDIGHPINEFYNVECPKNWYLLYSNMNYFVYSKTKTKITVLKMYDYREDFIYDLFGIEMRSKESKQFWGE